MPEYIVRITEILPNGGDSYLYGVDDLHDALMLYLGYKDQMQSFQRRHEWLQRDRHAHTFLFTFTHNGQLHQIDLGIIPFEAGYLMGPVNHEV